MKVGDDEETLVLVLQPDAVLDGAHVVSKVKESGRPVPGKNAFFAVIFHSNARIAPNDAELQGRDLFADNQGMKKSMIGALAALALAMRIPAAAADLTVGPSDVKIIQSP